MVGNHRFELYLAESQSAVLPLHHIPHIEQEPRKPARPYPTPRTRLVSFSVDTFGTFTDIHGFLSALVRYQVVYVIESLLNLLIRANPILGCI